MLEQLGVNLGRQRQSQSAARPGRNEVRASGDSACLLTAQTNGKNKTAL
jgi:hypothetical protein